MDIVQKIECIPCIQCQSKAKSVSKRLKVQLKVLKNLCTRSGNAHSSMAQEYAFKHIFIHIYDTPKNT